MAVHSGFYTRATGNHHDDGQTIRGPLRIGSVWAGLSFELESRDPAPAVGVSLDRWYTLGQRTFYRNQDYETGGLHPWVIDADEEWFYLFYSTGRRSLGLIRAPKRSVLQPSQQRFLPERPAGRSGRKRCWEPGVGGRIHAISSLSRHAKARWRFTPKAKATVNAWAVPE